MVKRDLIKGHGPKQKAVTFHPFLSTTLRVVDGRDQRASLTQFFGGLNWEGFGQIFPRIGAEGKFAGGAMHMLSLSLP